MPVEEIEKIVTLFRPLGLEKLHLSGGEPTLHSEFDRILDFAEGYALSVGEALCLSVQTIR